MAGISAGSELLISSGIRNLIQLVFMTLFFLTGSIMIIWSLKKLLFKGPENPGLGMKMNRNI